MATEDVKNAMPITQKGALAVQGVQNCVEYSSSACIICLTKIIIIHTVGLPFNRKNKAFEIIDALLQHTF